MLKFILFPFLLFYGSQSHQGLSTPAPTENIAPRVVGSIDHQLVIADEFFSFTVSDVFRDEDPLAYSADMPSFVSFNRDRHEFYGKPHGENIGIYNISLTATDTGGLSVTSCFLLEVAGDEDASRLDEEESHEGAVVAWSLFGGGVAIFLADAIGYARWRAKKKEEEEEQEEDASSALLSCQNYRNECCKGNFKFLSCYNKCSWCHRLFSCMCDKCCSEGSCNCYQGKASAREGASFISMQELSRGGINGNNRASIVIINSKDATNVSIVHDEARKYEKDIHPVSSEEDGEKETLLQKEMYGGSAAHDDLSGAINQELVAKEAQGKKLAHELDEESGHLAQKNEVVKNKDRKVRKACPMLFQDVRELKLLIEKDIEVVSEASISHFIEKTKEIKSKIEKSSQDAQDLCKAYQDKSYPSSQYVVQKKIEDYKSLLDEFAICCEVLDRLENYVDKEKASKLGFGKALSTHAHISKLLSAKIERDPDTQPIPLADTLGVV